MTTIDYRAIANDFIVYANDIGLARRIDSANEGPNDLEHYIEEWLFDSLGAGSDGDVYAGVFIRESKVPGHWGDNNITEVADEVAKLINLPAHGQLTVR